MPRKQLTIKPKEVGSTIKFGKLPLFTSSLTHWADMDNVVQLKVEGRHYAIELRPTPPNPLELALEKMREATEKGDLEITCEELEDEKDEDKTASFKEYPTKTNYQIGRDRFLKLKEFADGGGLADCKNRLELCEKLGFEPRNNSTGYNWLSNQIKKGYLEEKLVRYNKQNSGEYEYRLTGEEPSYSGNKQILKRAKPKGLEEMGFVNLSAPAKPTKAKRTYQKRTPGVDYAGRPVERGDLSLWEWLNKDDYVINQLFVSDSGRPLMEKLVDYDDVCLLFLNAGMPDRGKGRNPNQKGKTAQNYTNVAIAQLLRKGILQKDEEDGVKRYGLTLTKGGKYARALYAVVREGKYKWDSKSNRRLVI